MHYNYTPLHIAVTNKHLNIIALLLENQADVTAETEMGLTALHLSA